MLHLASDCRLLLADLVPASSIFFPRYHDDGRSIRDVAIHRRLSCISKESRHRIKIFLRNGIKLVIVAGRTTHRKTEPDRTGGVDPILGVDGLKLFDDEAALIAGDIAAVEPRRDLLIEGAVGQEVTGKLLDSESVKRKVTVEGLNHPITIGPHFAVVVDMDAVRVRIASRVQPVTSPMFTPAVGS